MTRRTPKDRFAAPAPTFHSYAAVCPTCRYENDMPSECLQEHWQALACDRCNQALEYRGVITGDPQNGGYEIETRITTPSRATGAADKTPGGEGNGLKGKSADRLILDDPAGQKGAEGPQDRGEPIGRGEKVSDSHNPYRRRFEIEGDRLMMLGAASQAGQDALNEYWQGLGRDLGFVWTTVQDLEAAEFREVGDREVATFTAEVEDAIPLSPAFDEWWRANRNSLPGMRNQIAREAWDAGARHAATFLVRIDAGVVEVFREIEVEKHDDQKATGVAMLMGALYGAVVGVGGTLSALWFGGWI